MNKHDTKKQPKTNPTQKRNPKTNDNNSKKSTINKKQERACYPGNTEKLAQTLDQEYPALESFAKILENEPKPPRNAIKFRIPNSELPKHLDRAIIAAETYTERDQLCRRLSSYCYKISKMFLSQQNYQQAHRWMTLSLNYLHLSMDPKKMQMDEKFEAELEEFRKEIEEAKRKREEESRLRYP
jgi:hypothetical protein